MILICRFRFSNSVLAGPFAGCSLVTWAVGLVDVRDFGNKGIIRVGVCEHRTDGEQHWNMLDIKRRYRLRLGVLTLRDGECGAPLVPQDVQTNAAVRVDVGVVDAGSEVDLGRLEGVVGREVNGQEEDTA